MTDDSTDRWYHVDTTHGSYNAMKSSAAARHAEHAPGTVLSIHENTSGTEALVKIRTGGDWSPGWESAPFIIRKFTPDDHNEAQILVRGPNWPQ